MKKTERRKCTLKFLLNCQNNDIFCKFVSWKNLNRQPFEKKLEKLDEKTKKKALKNSKSYLMKMPHGLELFKVLIILTIIQVFFDYHEKGKKMD